MTLDFLLGIEYGTGQKMSSSKKGREHIPLLETGEKSKRSNQLVIKREREMWENEDVEEETKDKQLFAENMNRGASLLFQDTLILMFQMLQVNA